MLFTASDGSSSAMVAVLNFWPEYSRSVLLTALTGISSVMSIFVAEMNKGSGGLISLVTVVLGLSSARVDI